MYEPSIDIGRSAIPFAFQTCAHPFTQRLPCLPQNARKPTLLTEAMVGTRTPSTRKGVRARARLGVMRKGTSSFVSSIPCSIGIRDGVGSFRVIGQALAYALLHPVTRKPANPSHSINAIPRPNATPTFTPTHLIAVARAELDREEAGAAFVEDELVRRAVPAGQHVAEQRRDAQLCRKRVLLVLCLRWGDVLRR